MAQYRTTCGTQINYTLRRSAKKNIIVRHGADNLLRINVPPFVSAPQWQAWLRANEAVLLKLWRQWPPPMADGLPENLWYLGERYPCRFDGDEQTPLWCVQHGFRLPESSRGNMVTAKQHVRSFLQQQAQAVLPAQLRQQATQLQRRPAAVALSRAKTFWGVCRPNSGIRLNWRLIGAPDWVTDYVCVHELCHLSHANHSPAFWALVNRHTKHTQAAKAWLQQHGQALFALD